MAGVTRMGRNLCPAGVTGLRRSLAGKQTGRGLAASGPSGFSARIYACTFCPGDDTWLSRSRTGHAEKAGRPATASGHLRHVPLVCHVSYGRLADADSVILAGAWTWLPGLSNAERGRANRNARPI